MIPALIRRTIAAWTAWRTRRRLEKAIPVLAELRRERAIRSRQHRSTRPTDAAIRRAMTMRLAHECRAMEPEWTEAGEP